MKTYRSPRGNNDYKPVPFILPKNKVKDLMNELYKDVLMEDIHNCSNVPYFEDKWDEILKGTFNFNMCKLSFDNWPESLLPGYYKLVVESFDENDSLSVILEIELTP